MMSSAPTHRVLILGGGFGGLFAARALRRGPVSVCLVDRRNFHLFQPLLYQVATGGLSPANIATPLRSIVKNQRHTRVVMAEAVDIDVEERHVLLREGDTLPYDTLIVATGSRHQYFGHEKWERHAPGLKTLEDATQIRARVLSAFEAAEREPDPGRIRRLLNFVVVGAGPTGVELAGALAEISRRTLRDDFRDIDPTSAQILLLEGSDRVLPPYPPSLSAKAEESLRRLGVTVRTRCKLTAVEEHGVTIEQDGRPEHIATRTVLWAAGIQASPLARILAEKTGASLDRTGRIEVQPDLSLPGHPEILVLGDMARFGHGSDEPLAAVAPVAMQQGAYAARLVLHRLKGEDPVSPFRFRDVGKMATIGRAAAVVDLGGLRFAGFAAWLTWLFVHLLYLVGFANRLLVLLQWATSYLTWNRTARLIMEPERDPPEPERPQAGGTG